MDTQILRNRPAYTLDRETAPAMWLVGTLWLIQATGIQTNNRSAFLEQLMPRGLGPPTHRMARIHGHSLPHQHVPHTHCAGWVRLTLMDRQESVRKAVSRM